MEPPLHQARLLAAQVAVDARGQQQHGLTIRGRQTAAAQHGAGHLGRGHRMVGTAHDLQEHPRELAEVQPAVTGADSHSPRVERQAASLNQA